MIYLLLKWAIILIGNLYAQGRSFHLWLSLIAGRREENATYTTYVKNQQSYNPSSSGILACACSVINYPNFIIFTGKQKSRHGITLYVVVVASTVSISIKGRQKKCVHTKRSLENSIPRAYHDSMLNVEMAVCLFQHIPMSWVLVSSSIYHFLRAPNKR